MGINQKLAEIQRELKAPKGQENSFGKYRYRSCEDILESVKPILSKTGTVLTLSDSLQHIGDRYYIQAVATITEAGTGESVSVSAFAREEESKKGMDGSQVTGASSSYARKYALNGLFCIDDTKDSDATSQCDQPDKAETKAQRFEARGPKCEQCGAEIKDYDDGHDIIPAMALAKRSKEKCGKILCISCGKKFKAGGTA